MIQNKGIRILAIAPLSRGLGYAVMEGPDKLVACGNKAILRDKNAKALAWVNRFTHFYQPDVLYYFAFNLTLTIQSKPVREWIWAGADSNWRRRRSNAVSTAVMESKS